MSSASREAIWREWLLPRPRIQQRLGRAIRGHRLALLVAPQGYGKTVALRQFFADASEPTVFHRCAPSATSLLPFLRGFSESLTHVAPGMRLSLANAYDRAVASPLPANELAVWIEEHLKAAHGHTIVVDDFHHAAVDGQVEDVLIRSIDATNANVRWVIATRSVDNLPVASWLAEERLDLPVDATDLLFEIDDLDAEPGHRLIRSKRASQLVEATNGIPARAALALALDGAPTLKPGPHLPRSLAYRALAEALLTEVPVDERLDVECTAFLPDLDQRVLDEAIPRDGSRILDTVAEYAPVVQSWPGESPVYDSTFAVLLQQTATERGADELSDSVTRAAAALERVDRAAEAISLYKRGGSAKHIARILTSLGKRLVEQGLSDVVASALESLDGSEFAETSPILTLRAVREAHSGRRDTSEAYFRLAVERAADESQRIHAAYRYAAELLRWQRLDAIEWLQPYAETTHELQPLICATLATTLALLARKEEARVLIGRALDDVSGVDPAMDAQIHHCASFVAHLLGDGVLSARHAERAIEIAVPIGHFDLAARAYTALYEEACLVQEDIEQGLYFVGRVAEFAAKAGSSYMLLWSLAVAFYLHVQRGDVEDLKHLDRDLNRTGDWRLIPNLGATIVDAQAMRCAWKGEFSRAMRLLEHSLEQKELPERQAGRLADIALYCAASGDVRRAILAIRIAVRAIRKSETRDMQVDQARAHVSIAMLLVGNVRGASRMIAALDATPGTVKYSAVMIRMVRALGTRWYEAADYHDLCDAIDTLRAHGYGGHGLLIDALPAAPFRAPAKHRCRSQYSAHWQCSTHCVPAETRT